MGGFFGAVRKKSVVLDVFLGTDYHSPKEPVPGGRRFDYHNCQELKLNMFKN